MRGYFSFILVFVSLLLIFTLLSVSLQSDLSKAISVERAYGISMNVKEVIIETLKHGTNDGFSQYDLTHEISLCRHCMDHFCTYDRDFPNYCDDFLCSKCFRESDARAAAISSARIKLFSLKNHQFDPDFNITIHDPQISVFLYPNQLAKNGFSIDYLRFENDGKITLSSKFLLTNSTLPKGLVIPCH
ncbi:MAG: hypothetical protein ABID61_04100 [Candidatus Micrarchaeota archaeon]